MVHRVVLRMNKLKTISQIRGRAVHNFRERHTLNAEESLKPKNINGGCITAQSVVEKFKELMPSKIRKNAVLGIEYVITAKKAYFNEDPKRGQDYLKAALEEFKKEHGEESIIGWSIHNDERTPHLHILVIPRVLDKNNNYKLNARKFVGTKGILSKLQTRFHKNVGSKYGLSRGIKRTGVKHTSPKTFYGLIEQEMSIPEIKTPKPKPLPKKTIKENVPFTNDFNKRKDKEEKYEAQLKQHNKELKAQNIAKIKYFDVAQSKAVAFDLNVQYSMEMSKKIQKHQDEIDELNRKLEFEKSQREKELQEKTAAAKAIAKVLKSTYTPEQLFSKFHLQPTRTKADIFETLVKQGIVKSFVQAVEFVASKFSVKPEWYDFNTGGCGSENEIKIPVDFKNNPMAQIPTTQIYATDKDMGFCGPSGPK